MFTEISLKSRVCLKDPPPKLKASCQCSGTLREELFSKKHNPDGTKKGIGRPVGSQGVKAKAKPSVFSAASRASSLAAIPKNA